MRVGQNRNVQIQASAPALIPEYVKNTPTHTHVQKMCVAVDSLSTDGHTHTHMWCVAMC